MKVFVRAVCEKPISVREYDVSDHLELQVKLKDEIEKSIAIFINGKEAKSLSSVEDRDFVAIVPKWEYVDIETRKKYEEEDNEDHRGFRKASGRAAD